MTTIRKIAKVFSGRPVIEGAGVHLNRVFGFSEVPIFDPFLLLDDFRSDIPEEYVRGFPWHPHRGIETITYVLKGDVEHGDSMGNKGIISSGDVQWMTAGCGIIHQEMPKGDQKGAMHGFQLWANLPAKNKMMPPRYQEIKSSSIPEIVVGKNVKIKVISGVVGNQKGPVRNIVIDPIYLDITVPANTEFIHPTEKDHNAFAYIIDGKCYFCKDKDPFTYEIQNPNYFQMDRPTFVENGMLALFKYGNEIIVITESEPVRFLFISGKPIKETVAWQGPIVMNTQEELRVAFEEYRNGKFIK
jgi:quercetin 2,3-dioxygenase